MRGPHVRRQDYRDPVLVHQELRRRDAHGNGAGAEKTLRNLTGAWVKSQKLVIENGKITSTACS